jgi:signal transduction histidine kinase
MMRPGPRLTVALFSILLIGGLVLLVAGATVRIGADATVLAATSATVSRIREMDGIALAARGQGARAAADLEEAFLQAAEPGEAEMLGWARSCLAPGGECAHDPSRALDRVRHYYGDRLERRWSAAHRRHRDAWVLGGGGLLLCFGAFAIGFVALSQPPVKILAESPERALVERTLRHRLEELYAARLRAWQSDRFAAAGEIAAGLSHGLKTPLASIRAAAQLAQVKLEDGHPAARQLEDIIGETDSLVEQIRRFLNASGAVEPLAARLRPAQLVEALERDFAGRARDRGIHWRTRLEPEVPDVYVDPGLLEMACRNLVENALAAAPSGSTVTVTAQSTPPPSRAGLDETPPGPGRWIEIAVRDEGAGIPAQVGAGVMERSQKPGGSGLGVAIARRIVARHGGVLIFEGGIGTAARVLLPAAEPAEPLVEAS